MSSAFVLVFISVSAHAEDTTRLLGCNVPVSAAYRSAVIRAVEKLSEQELAAMALLNDGQKPALGNLYEAGREVTPKHRLTEIKSYLDKMIETNPCLSDAYLARGKIELMAGSIDRAFKDLTLSLDLTAGDARYEALYWRAWAWMSKADLKQALVEFTRAIEMKPDYADAHFGRGMVRELMGESSFAIIEYSRALSFDQSHRLSNQSLQRLKAKQ